jgi:hypothetical protein
LCILVLLALLVAWAVTFAGGDGGGGGTPSGQKGGGPVESITPGPSASQSLPDDRPGGRDEVDGGAGGSASDSGTTGTTRGTAGDGGTGGGSATGGAGGSSGGGGAGEGGGGSLTGGDGVPAGSGIPACTAQHVTATLRSKKNTYEPGHDPVLTLTLRNDGDADCVADLGDEGTVTTVTDAEDDEVWASDDCPEGGAHAWVRVSAHDSSTHEITWDRRRSDPECATPSGRRAAAGTYLAEVSVGGLHRARTSFVLAKS